MSDSLAKFSNILDLGTESSEMSHDSLKVIFNYSSHVLIEILLWRGQNVAIPLDKLNYSDFLLPFKLFHLENLYVTDQKKQLLKARMKDIVLSSFNSYSKNSTPLNLTKENLSR